MDPLLILNNFTSAQVKLFFTQIAAVVMTISRNKATDDENQILTMSAAASKIAPDNCARRY